MGPKHSFETASNSVLMCSLHFYCLCYLNAASPLHAIEGKTVQNWPLNTLNWIRELKEDMETATTPILIPIFIDEADFCFLCAVLNTYKALGAINCLGCPGCSQTWHRSALVSPKHPPPGQWRPCSRKMEPQEPPFRHIHSTLICWESACKPQTSQKRHFNQVAPQL